MARPYTYSEVLGEFIVTDGTPILYINLASPRFTAVLTDLNGLEVSDGLNSIEVIEGELDVGVLGHNTAYLLKDHLDASNLALLTALVSTVQNLGLVGASVFAQKIGVDVQLRKIQSSDGSINIVENAEDIDITTSGGGGGGGAASTYWETVTVWTLDTGNDYYADVVHNFKTKDLFLAFWNTVNDEEVDLKAEATDVNTVRVFVVGNTHTIRVGVTTGVAQGTAVGTLSSWTLDTGNQYYADFAHNLNSLDIRPELYNTVNNKDVDADFERLDVDTVRVRVIGNTHSLRITVKL